MSNLGTYVGSCYTPESGYLAGFYFNGFPNFGYEISCATTPKQFEFTVITEDPNDPNNQAIIPLTCSYDQNFVLAPWQVAAGWDILPFTANNGYAKFSLPLFNENSYSITQQNMPVNATAAPIATIDIMTQAFPELFRAAKFLLSSSDPNVTIQETPYISSGAFFINVEGCQSTSIGNNTTVETKKITVFPTVCDNFIRIETTQPLLLVNLYGLSGQIAHEVTYSEDRKLINTEQIPSGIYFLKIITTNEQKTFKIVKN